MTDAEIRALPPRRRYWLPGILLLACGFLAGALCGGSLVARHVLSKIQKGIEYPESRVEETVMQMSRNLELAPDQQEKIRTILTSQDKELLSLRQQIWPKVTARLEQTEKEITAVLNQEQAQKWRNVVADNRRQWGPPGGGPMGGMRPPPKFGEGHRPGDVRPGEGRPGKGRPGDPNWQPPRGGQQRDPGGLPGPRPNRPQAGTGADDELQDPSDPPPPPRPEDQN